MMRLSTFFFALGVSFLCLSTCSSVFAGNDGKDSDKPNKKKDKKVSLIDGVDNLLYQKRKRDIALENTTLKDASLCDLEAKFNMKIEGLSVEFTNRSNGEFTDIEWTFGDGYLSQDILSTQHTYEKAGMYYFSITVYNALDSCIDVYSGQYFLNQKKQIIRN